MQQTLDTDILLKLRQQPSFIITILTEQRHGKITATHTTQSGIKHTIKIDYMPNLSPTDNHLYACLYLAQQQGMQAEYWCILEPKSYQQLNSRGFTYYMVCDEAN